MKREDRGRVLHEVDTPVSLMIGMQQHTGTIVGYAEWKDGEWDRVGYVVALDRTYSGLKYIVASVAAVDPTVRGDNLTGE